MDIFALAKLGAQ